MMHTEFCAGFRNGAIKVEIDAKGAARYLGTRLLLPFVTLALLGAGVALALTGWTFTGITIIAIGILLPRLIKRSAAHFVLRQALEDERVFQEVTQSRILQILPRE